MIRSRLALLSLLIAPIPPVTAQSPVPRDAQEQVPPLRLLPTPVAQPNRVADAPAGEIGRRRMKEKDPVVAPLARIDARIPNRVQSRIRNRIDRNYDPKANATSPFVLAEAQTKTPKKVRR